MSLSSPFDRLFLSPVFVLLYDQVTQHLGGEATDWLAQSLRSAAQGNVRSLVPAFSVTARKVGKESLYPSPTEISRADSIYPGWTINHWSLDQAARTLLLLAFPADDMARYRAAINLLFSNADIGELIALYQSLPVLPHAESFCSQAVNGVRSSMTAVFEAIALQNPYPADHFDRAAWNQMVLKALFEESPLFLIQGIDQRANAELAKMLAAYAHERWAARRQISPELWRSVGPFATGEIVNDLRRALEEGDRTQREAVALACCQSEEARSLLDNRPKLIAKIKSGQINWERIGKRVAQTTQ